MPLVYMICMVMSGSGVRIGMIVIIIKKVRDLILKDLIVDLDPFLEKVRLIRPYLTAAASPPERERKQTQEENKSLDKVIRCILCACCTAACPVANQNETFIGPAPLGWAFRYIFDSRDDQYLERLKQVDEPNGV